MKLKYALFVGMTLLPAVAFAQSAGTVSLPKGNQINTPASVSAAVNAALQTKADTNNGVLNNAQLTGVSTAPTASAGTSSIQISTTAFTGAAVGVEATRATAAEALLLSTSTAASTYAGISSLSARSILTFGAVCNGTTDDSAAILAAEASGFRISIPAGDTCYGATVGQSTISAAFVGPGQIKTSDGNLRGPTVSFLSAPPASLGNWSSILTAFNGDLSKTPIVIERRITGATTLGQPASGYLLEPEASVFASYLYNTSGWNTLGSSAGRTGAASIYLNEDQAGQGDLASIYCSGIVSSTSPAGNFINDPAALCLNGQLTASQPGAYLEGIGDLDFADNGHDISAFGTVFNMTRTSPDTGVYGDNWVGHWIHSKGTYPIDADMGFTGLSNIGIDMTGETFSATKAAMTLPVGARIYGSATNSNNTKFPLYTVPGANYFDYNGTSWEFIGGPITSNGSAVLTTASGYAPLSSPNFTGTLTAQIANLGASGSFANWSTTSPVFNVPAVTLTDTTGSGTIALRVAESINSCTFAASSAETLTTSACLYVGAPVAGTNVTNSAPYSIYAAAGIYAANNIVSGGNVFVGSSSALTGGELQVNGTPVPPVGLNRPATNQLGFYTNSIPAGIIDANQHWRIGGSGTPAIGANACGSTTQGAIASGGNDQGFQVTVGTASVTSCTITFASAFTTAPRTAQLTPANSTAAAQNTTLAYVSALGATSMTIAGSALAGASYYVQVK